MRGVRGRVRGSRKVSKLAPKDVLSTMPEEVIANILHCLPLQDAVQTSILSKDWKFKWTMMTQLVFDDNFHEYLEATENKNDYEWIISRVLLLLNGAITKFVLYLPYEDRVDVKHIDNWIIYLSKKGIKEFTYIGARAELELTTHLFSCLELTHLELDTCILCPWLDFGGFPNLLSLDLSNVFFETSKFWELLTRSPLLETLKLQSNDTEKEKIKQAEISKLENLKILSLCLCEIENMTMFTSSSIFQLVGSLLKLQELSLYFHDCEILADAEYKVPTSLPCLKTLNLHNIDFTSDSMISCAIELICSSPNLETLSIQGAYKVRVPLPAVCSSKVDFSRMGWLQLLKVKLKRIRGIENEVCLIKYLLDSSPLLKKMDIYAHSWKVRELGGDNGEKNFATKLLKLRRASTLAEIDIVWC